MNVAANDWHGIEDTINEHCDIIYLGKGMKSTVDSSIIIAFTKPSLPSSKDGVNCVFGDAHVEFVRREALQSTFEATNELRKNVGPF